MLLLNYFIIEAWERFETNLDDTKKVQILHNDCLFKCSNFFTFCLRTLGALPTGFSPEIFILPRALASSTPLHSSFWSKAEMWYINGVLALKVSVMPCKVVATADSDARMRLATTASASFSAAATIFFEAMLLAV